MTTSSIHRNNFNLLRLLAALAVLWSHSGFLYRLHLDVPFAGHSLGAVAVYVFFFISGYLIAQSWARSDGWLDFAVKRLARIFPGLMVAAVFAVAVVGATMTSWAQVDYWASPVTWTHLVNNAFGLATVQVLPGVFEHNPFAFAVNGSLWTIRYELTMYFLLALVSSLGAFGVRWGFGVVVLGLAVTWLLATFLGWPEAPAAAPGWLNELWSVKQICALGVYFFIGSAFARMNWRAHWWTGLLGVVALLLAHWSASAMLIQIFLWVGVSCTTFFLAFWGRGRTKGRPHEDLSYGVYIYAFPIQQAVTQVCLANGWSLATCVGLSLVLTLFLAAVSWFFVEKPALAFTRRWLSARKKDDVPAVVAS